MRWQEVIYAGASDGPQIEAWSQGTIKMDLKSVKYFPGSPEYLGMI